MSKYQAIEDRLHLDPNSDVGKRAMEMAMLGMGSIGKSSELAPEIQAIAKKIIDLVKTPEAGAALKGAERQEYLDALTAIHGPQEQRAQDMGFSPETYYHGSVNSVDAFDPLKNRNYVSGRGTYVTPSAQKAGDYANLSMKPEVRELNANLKQGKLSFKDYNDAVERGAQIYPLKIKKGNNYNLDSDTNELEKFTRGNGDQLTQILNDSGVDSVEGYGGDKTFSILNPANIRSTNAAFDPRFKNSSNILAGLTGLGTAGLIQQNMSPDGDEMKKRALQSLIDGGGS